MALVVGVEHGWLRGGGLALYGLLVVGTVDNVVRPLLTKRGLQLYPPWVFIGVFPGMLAFGLVGLLVGPLVVALMITILDVYERHVSGEGIPRCFQCSLRIMVLQDITRPR